MSSYCRTHREMVNLRENRVCAKITCPSILLLTIKRLLPNVHPISPLFRSTYTNEMCSFSVLGQVSPRRSDESSKASTLSALDTPDHSLCTRDCKTDTGSQYTISRSFARRYFHSHSLPSPSSRLVWLKLDGWK